jgi:hypothetical protein
MVEAGGSLPGCLQQQRRAGSHASFQLPRAHPQQVVPPSQGAGVEGHRQPLGHRPHSAQRQGGPQHLAIQRVGEPSERPAAGSLQHQQASPLGCLDRVLVDEPFEHPDGQRLTPGDQLNGSPGRLVHSAEASLDDLG